MQYCKRLARLEELFLGDTAVSDVGLGHLKGLTQLKLVHLSGTKVTAAGMKDLRKALPKADVTCDGYSVRRDPWQWIPP